jgi:ElaA protein
MDYSYVVRHFKELTPFELYAIMRLRNEVFVIEQQCIYQDADNKDLYCHHLSVYDGKELIGYARLVPAGLSYDEISIGRVVSSPAVRGTGIGKKVMIAAIENCHKIFGRAPIRIGAQLYAKAFYEALGFEESGSVYDEDGIAHIPMVLR